MEYIYQIKNSDYETKKVVAPDMGAALYKYKKHLDEHISVDYSSQEIYEKVTSCELVGVYQENDMIM
jgi:hypothetical protein